MSSNLPSKEKIAYDNPSNSNYLKSARFPEEVQGDRKKPKNITKIFHLHEGVSRSNSKIGHTAESNETPATKVTVQELQKTKESSFFIPKELSEKDFIHEALPVLSQNPKHMYNIPIPIDLSNKMINFKNMERGLFKYDKDNLDNYYVVRKENYEKGEVFGRKLIFDFEPNKNEPCSNFGQVLLYC